jgi:hypothetical protein
MRTPRLTVVLAVLAIACWSLLAAGPVALGKENVTARLLTPLRLDAAPGEKITVVWALAGAAENGRRQPFTAIGVFVRLLRDPRGIVRTSGMVIRRLLAGRCSSTRHAIGDVAAALRPVPRR